MKEMLPYGSQLKLTRIPETKTTHAKDIGRKIFQPSRINWSYLYLGKAARTQTKRNKKQTVFNPNQNNPGTHSKKTNEIGESQPPRKKMTHNVLITIIFAYSPKKKRAKPIDEYSTLNPATNSASASGKSKGARFVSAKQEIKNKIKIGNKGRQNHTFC
jgi:Holliday junction resolvase RusA-like endonuclease